MDEVRFAAGTQYCEWVLACFYLGQERKQFGLITATSITNNMKEHAKDFALCVRDLGYLHDFTIEVRSVCVITRK
jgi:hypothetical protein